MSYLVHVTRRTGREVYGHETAHCDPAGCAGNELFFGCFDGVTAGKTYELGKDANGSGTWAYEISEETESRKR